MISLVLLYVAGVIYSPYPTDSDERFNSLIDEKLALHEYAERARESEGTHRREEYLIRFFKAFPKDFETFFKIVHSRQCHGDLFYTVSNSWGYSSLFNNPWNSYHPINKVVSSSDELPQEEPSRGRLQYFKERLKAGKYPSWIKNYDDLSVMFFIEGGGPEDSIILFSVEKVIPAKIFYEKILSIGIGGFWDADDVNGLQLF